LNLNDLNLNKLNHQTLDLSGQSKFSQCIPISSMRQKKLKNSIFFDDKSDINKAETKNENKKISVNKNYVKK
jgi:hypothetical protein